MSNTIIIVGPASSGKTTLALALEEFLKSKGFSDVTVTDADTVHGCHYPEFQEKRMEAIKDRPVTIKTMF